MSEILTRTPPTPGERVYYGSDTSQFAELRFPPGNGPFPILFVIHGGFWSSAFDLSHLGHFCAKLTSCGIITCSLEYRRVGDEGGGWPGTFLDVASGTEYFRDKMLNNARVDIRRTGVIGHSAGGHLALWLAGRHRLPEGSKLGTNRQPWLTTVISLAGVTDLTTAWTLQLGSGAVRRLIGGTPDQYPERYREASPIELVPMGLRQVLIHGRNDEIVPLSQSERFSHSAKAAGDDPWLLALDGVSHFELIDPESQAWDEVVEATKKALELV